ncbi:MAG: 1-deoxy-D-xylulose-5-phosphate synthase [Alphaproteobacteria bacterium]|nr:1-deoxy-D-xylulose-5-phosphate synthase [Alphaproteobacteria bacterium]
MSNKILDKINFPSELKELSLANLENLAVELRNKTIDTVSKTGGHLGAGLGVVELTIALHYVFNTPRDRLIWDVGHQTYPHKILTGRKNKIETLRQKNGLYGFVKRSESEYDPFGTAHSSTSISAGMGMKIAKDLNKDNANIICVIGDGALSAGMAYEALNNVGASNKQMVVILNDNEMSIDRPVGAMSNYLTRLLSSKQYTNVRSLLKKISAKFPASISKTLYKAEEYSKGLVSGGTLFEELGFYYLGPIDGHDLKTLVPVLENIKKSDVGKPIFLHCITKKGKGYEPAEKSDDKFHGVNKFNIETGQSISKSNKKSYSKVFGETLSKVAETDEKIIAITAAMMSGTGLDIFRSQHPAKFFDVGIAEQHAVTMAAGLATEGFKPFVAIYSTFLQRAYDQVVHDVSLQKLPVRFAIDRAGLVGSDGPTHAGSFDITYLSTLPNFIIMAPSNQNELIRMINTSVLIDDRPSAFRYPRGTGAIDNTDLNYDSVEIGKGIIIKEGNDVAILNLGTRMQSCEEAIKLLNSLNIYPTLADARFAKPIDKNLIDKLLDNHKYLITIEEGSSGGFGSSVLNYIHNDRRKATLTKVNNIYFPDRYIDHQSSDDQYREIGMDTDSIANKVIKFYHDNVIDFDTYNKNIKN